MKPSDQPHDQHFAPGRDRCCSPGSSLIKAFLLGLVFVSLVLMAFAGPGYAGGKRVALVMAVEEYAHFAKSPITAKTGEEIARALERHGFEVLMSANPNNAVARATLRDFATKAEGAETALVVLSGHGASSGGRTYLLPSNAEITRDTDLLSRALAVGSVAQIAAKAKFGGVFFLLSVAEISSTIQSISVRPSMAPGTERNVVVVFSTSDKVPVSRVDKVSEQAARDFAEAAGETPLLLATLVNAAAAGGVGKVVGTPPELDLSAPPPPAPTAQPAAAADAREIEARRAAEARARQAEERAREAETRARQAEERARQAAAKSAAEPPAAAPQSVAAAPEPADDITSLQIVEALLGRSQRKQVQAKLRQLGYYKGGIDAIFGELTRAAIKDYQRSIDASASGYLTPQQFQTLINN